MNTAAERRWFAAVASLESCVLCGAYGVQVAHRDFGKGMGMKTKAWMTCPLCLACHQELTDGKKYTRDEKRALMDRAIVEAHDRLIQSEKLRLV